MPKNAKLSQDFEKVEVQTGSRVSRHEIPVDSPLTKLKSIQFITENTILPRANQVNERTFTFLANLSSLPVNSEVVETVLMKTDPLSAARCPLNSIT